MDRTETLKIMAVLQAAYPQFYAKQGRDEIRQTVCLWEDMFSEEPYPVVAAAVKALIKTRENSFPPSIGEINAKIMQVTRPEELTELEAWGLVMEAVKNSGYNSREEFDKLPETVRRVVGSPNQLREWSMMDLDTVNSVVSSNFQRSYRARLKSEREYRALPASVKEFMRKIAGGLDMKRIEEKNRDEEAV